MSNKKHSLLCAIFSSAAFWRALVCGVLLYTATHYFILAFFVASPVMEHIVSYGMLVVEGIVSHMQLDA